MPGSLKECSIPLLLSAKCMRAVYISQGFIRESPTIATRIQSVYLDSATCGVLPHPNKSFHPPEVRKTERGPTQNAF